MRSIVMSESHGDSSRVRQIFEDNPGADHFIHLGDGAKDFEEAGWLYPDTVRNGVRGNCDFGSGFQLPKEGLLELEGARIYFTHGDLWRVKYGLDEIWRSTGTASGSSTPAASGTAATPRRGTWPWTSARRASCRCLEIFKIFPPPVYSLFILRRLAFWYNSN